MAVKAYPTEPKSVTTVAPYRRPRVRDNGDGEPLIRVETTDALARVTITHRYLTTTELTTLQTWLTGVADADTVTVAAIDGKTYEGRFVDRLYTVQGEGPRRRATIQLVGNPQ